MPEQSEPYNNLDPRGKFVRNSFPKTVKIFATQSDGDGVASSTCNDSHTKQQPAKQ